MQIPTLSHQLSPLAVRRELRFTLVRLRSMTWAKSFVALFESLLTSCESHVAEQAKLRDAVEDADALVAHADADLDEVALFLHKLVALETTGETRLTLHKKLFGGLTPSKFVRPKLGSELEQVRTWPTLLTTSSKPKLVATGATVSAVLKRCDAALLAQSTADVNLSAFQLNTWTPFVTQVNAERQSLGGEAKKQRRLDGSMGDLGLFRSLVRPRSPGPTTLEELAEQIAQTAAELTSLKNQQLALEAEQRSEAEARAQRAKKEAELAELRKIAAEATAKTRALEAELSARSSSATTVRSYPGQ